MDLESESRRVDAMAAASDPAAPEQAELLAEMRSHLKKVRTEVL